MKEKLAKKEFIKKFEYFKRNQAEYDKKKKVPSQNVLIWLLFPLNMYVPLIIHPFSSIPSWYFYMVIGYGVLFTLTIISLVLIHNFKNMKAIKFDNMVYTGKLSDLFEDVNHPVIVNAKHLLELDFKRKCGITGSTVFYLYEEINKVENAIKAVDIKSNDEKVTIA